MTVLALGLFVLNPVQDQTPTPPPPSIWDKLKIEADGRMRGEATLDAVDPATGNEADDRLRGRMRLRLGAKYALLDNVTVAARLSTASDANAGGLTDANNPHWDFGDGDGFSGSNFVVDRYYLDWAACKDTRVVVGKQPHALAVPPVFGDFLWDADISPSGVSATWKPATDESFSFDVRLAGYVATEAAADEDPKLYAAQGNAYVTAGKLKVQNSVALYDWADTQDVAVAGNQGNTNTQLDFQIFEDFFAATLTGGPLGEVTAFLQFLHNLSEAESGLVFGSQLGPSSWKRNDFNVFLLFYALDGDSVFSPVAQDDTPVAGTGLNDGDGDGMGGVIVGGTYYLRDNVGLKLWALTSHAEGAMDDPARLRLDLDFRIK